MNKTINFSYRDKAEKQYRDVTGKAQKPGLDDPSDSINRSTFAMNVSKPASRLAVAITVLSGCLVSVVPAYAGFNIPTDSTASPLCINGQCATPFTAKMLMFEEFGIQTMPSSGSNSSASGLPVPADCQSTPDGQALDNFLQQQIQPFPTRVANDSLPNAWEAKAKSCNVGLSANASTVAEGRPGGEQFAHQRWDEFFPAQTYFQTP